jgi:hypothetical protein
MAFGRIIQIESGSANQQGYLVTDNFMSFDITRDLTKNTDRAEIKIHNLSDATIALMSKAKNKIVIYAGYADEGGAKKIFQGDLYQSWITKEGTERILNISSHDGLAYTQSSNFIKSYASGISVDTVINDMVSAMGYPINGSIPITNMVYSNGYAFAGKVCDCLQKVLARAGLRYNIQNEQICIYADGTPIIPAAQLYLNYDTGLIFVEEKQRDNTVDAIKSAYRKPGTYYKVTTLIFPQIVPGAHIQIDTDAVPQTNLVIESCKLSGDNFGGKFQAEIDAKVINNG